MWSTFFSLGDMIFWKQLISFTLIINFEKDKNKSRSKSSSRTDSTKFPDSLAIHPSHLVDYLEHI